MIMHNLKTLCFICIVFVMLQTTNSVEKDCLKFNPDKSCRGNYVQFFFKNKNKRDKFHELDANDYSTIAKAGFIEENKTNKKIKFIVPGQPERHDDFLVSPLQEEYLNLDYNVVVMDYYELSEFGCYKTAVENSIMISTCAARMIEAIIDSNKGVTLTDFHLIGLSLGGQLVGQIPHILNKTIVGKGQIDRITALDPANPGFFEVYAEDIYTLTKTDAVLVDVIHTNSGLNGKLPPMGHIDWYPNLGIFQPGCPVDDDDYMCDHMRSLILFLESVGGDSNFTIVAERCANLQAKILNPQTPCEKIDKIHFGENFAKDELNGGVYFFKTKLKAPYIRENANTSYAVYKIHLDFKTYMKNMKKTETPPLGSIPH